MWGKREVWKKGGRGEASFLCGAALGGIVGGGVEK